MVVVVVVVGCFFVLVGIDYTLGVVGCWLVRICGWLFLGVGLCLMVVGWRLVVGASRLLVVVGWLLVVRCVCRWLVVCC